MRALRVLIFIAFLANSLVGAAFSAEPSFSNTYSTDGPIEAYKIENSFSSSTKGIDGVLANPAGIARSPTLEVSVGFADRISSSSHLTFTVSDESMEGFGGDSSFFDAGLYFTDDPADAPTNEFKSRDIGVNFNYDRGAGMTDVGVAFNFGDVFAFGISRKRPSSFGMDLSTRAPVLFRNTMDMHGVTLESPGGGLFIDSGGFGNFNDTVIGTSFVTSQPLYEKFTYNSSYAAVSTDISLVDSMTDNREVALTFGGRVGDFLWGINAIPISSNIILNNTAITKTSSNSADLVYYVPDFDTGNTLEVYSWYSDGYYTHEAGYTTYTIVLSPEALMYRGVATGSYTASTVRLDLGLIWQPFKDMSVSLVYENIGGAELVYSGVGVYSTLESYVSDSDPPDFQIGSNEAWNPLTDTPKVVEDTEGFYLPDEFKVTLPRKGKIGVAFTKPFLIAFDYETYFTDIVYEDMTISDLTFVRAGFESLLFGLPIVIRGESNFLLKPTITGLSDPDQLDQINDLFASLPAVPAEFKFGLGFRSYGYEVGTNFSENHASLMSIYEGELLDFMKVLSYDLYFKADTWDITYTAVAEPFYLIGQNADLIQVDGGGDISASDVETNWVYSVRFGYRF
jgi:hypothetical protein